LSFFNRQDGAAPAAAAADPTQVVDAARTRSRQRLIGAVVLLGIGVIAFPLLFETQPRPIPVDIPIEIPRKDGAPALAVPPPRPAVTPAKLAPAVPVITESKAEAGKDLAVPADSAAKVEPAAKAAEPKAPPQSVAKAEPKAQAQPVARAEPKPQAQPASKPEAKPVAEAAGRFVVQVGAFADAGVAREARAKVEKLGLHTYTQSVDTDNGKRIRVRLGPFVTRDEADKAAAKVKAAGLPAAVLTL
jgi:DedD protein